MKTRKKITLNYYESKQKGLKKRQYKVTIPAKMIDSLGWKSKDKLVVWVNNRKHIEIRKGS